MQTYIFAESSTIDHIGYDASTGSLSVTFHDSGTYIYADVPEAVFSAFCNAPSPGAFLNRHLKNRFRFSFDPARRRYGPKA